MRILRKKIFIFGMLISIMMTSSATAFEKKFSKNFEPMIASKFLEKAKKNKSWKVSFATASHAQIVFMNISLSTNPKNEVGIESHPFDQVILIVMGTGKMILNDKETLIKEGDMIFIPRGIKHNIINFSKYKELKLISFYTDNDMPKDVEYKQKIDENSSLGN